MSMMEWIAVCGCGSGGGSSGGLSDAQYEAEKARLLAERAEIYNNALLILQSGKGGTELNKVCAELLQLAAPTQNPNLHPGCFDTNLGWLGSLSRYGITYGGRIYAVLVRDSGGNMHFVPATKLSAYTFATLIGALAASPNVAAIDVRRMATTISQHALASTPTSSPPPERACGASYESSGEKAFGAIIIGQRYGSLQQMTDMVTGAVIPQAPPVLPATLEPSSPELTHPLAQATVPTTSQQTVGGTTFSPWLLVGGAAAVVAGVALLRRNK